MVEDLADDFGVDDESESFHPCPAARAGQRVHLEDAVDEIPPPFAQSSFGSRLDGFPLRPGRVGFHRWPVGLAQAVGVGPVEMDQVLVGLGDVDEDTGEKLERVDEGLSTSCPVLGS